MWKGGGWEGGRGVWEGAGGGEERKGECVLTARVCLQSPGDAEQRQWREGSGMRNAAHGGLNEDLFGGGFSQK